MYYIDVLFFILLHILYYIPDKVLMPNLTMEYDRAYNGDYGTCP